MKIKLSHTVWPNGHICYWSKVDVSKLFYINKFDDKVFAWFRLGKEITTTKK